MRDQCVKWLTCLPQCSRKGIPADSVIYNTLIDGYAKQGSLEEASEAFSRTSESEIKPNDNTSSYHLFEILTAKWDSSIYRFEPLNTNKWVYTWTAFMSLQSFYLHILKRNLCTMQRRQSNCLPYKKALSQFRRTLQRRGASAIDSYEVLRMLKAPGNKGTAIHALVVRLGFESVVFLQTALMGMYAEIGRLKDARRAFDETSHRTVVCWTVMMSGYVNNRRPGKALELFRLMQMDSMEPDQVTLTISLSACADLGALDVGKWIHTYISRRYCMVKGLHREDLILSNALLNMYTKCGDIGAARHLFDSAEKRDVTTWTSMILGHAMHGEAEKALGLFDEMKSERERHRIAPNQVTFIGVLTACSHAGLVEEGRRHWESMEKGYGLRPQIGHYGCMVDLLSRAGLLEEAYAFIERMPMQPNAVIWRTLLGACGLYGNASLGALARSRLFELEPGYAGDCVAMSNVYAAEGMWSAKQGIRRRMNRRRAPGCSLIEVGSGIHEFAAADRRHLNKAEIRVVLESLARSSDAPVTDEFPKHLP